MTERKKPRWVYDDALWARVFGQAERGEPYDHPELWGPGWLKDEARSAREEIERWRRTGCVPLEFVDPFGALRRTRDDTDTRD